VRANARHSAPSNAGSSGLRNFEFLFNGLVEWPAQFKRTA
jgi:hypothetical protein